VLAVSGELYPETHPLGDVSQRGARRAGRCDDDGVTTLWRTCVLAIALMAAIPTTHVVATAPPPTTPAETGPPVTNDLLPENNDVTNCIGTVEQANCGSKARADGHTYLVFLALAAGLTFIGWRIARGIRARDATHKPVA
jgi:hypothetical protein